jgi:hypothetical protein
MTRAARMRELTPMLARLRDLNYEREVILKMRHQKLKWMPERGESVVVETRPVRNIKLGQLSGYGQVAMVFVAG